MGLLAACERPEAIVPQTAQPAVVAGQNARVWFENTGRFGKSVRDADVTPAGPENTSQPVLQLQWAAAVTLQAGPQEHTLVPIVDNREMFENQDVAYRYLVIATTSGQQPTASILEIIAQNRRYSEAEAPALAHALYQRLQTGAGPLDGAFTGYAFLYDRTYAYRQGLSATAGAVVAGATRLQARRLGGPDTESCTDWYVRVNGAWAYYTTTCTNSVYIDPDIGQPIFPGPSGWGGPTDHPDLGSGNGSGGTNDDGFDPNDSNSYDATDDAMVTLDGPTLGDYGAVIRTRYDAASTLELKIEIDTRTHDVKKMVLTMAGLMGPTTLSQTGDGNFLRYDSSTNRYYFSVTFVVTGTGNTMYNGSNQFLSGWIDLDNDTARTRLYRP
ncbi:hypothetical protein SAMN02746009_01295 [Hymenobacter psychrotolerans DSM 18569]|uniref:Uncharacterized protein n=2 Tax=Hymenobacter psychrotolerans TaxID=344998 RepID=A0A1M6U2V9_9BACT|nr:hypothetical protein SAMN02746009_01295 [Hymenobacter psychrotolerans DSM 18569]